MGPTHSPAVRFDDGFLIRATTGNPFDAGFSWEQIEYPAASGGVLRTGVVSEWKRPKGWGIYPK